MLRRKRKSFLSHWTEFCMVGGTICWITIIAVYIFVNYFDSSLTITPTESQFGVTTRNLEIAALASSPSAYHEPIFENIKENEKDGELPSPVQDEKMNEERKRKQEEEEERQREREKRIAKARERRKEREEEEKTKQRETKREDSEEEKRENERGKEREQQQKQEETEKEKERIKGDDIKRQQHMQMGLVVLTHDRPDTLNVTLQSLQQAEGIERVSVYVSQDSDSYLVKDVIVSFPSVHHIQRPHTEGGVSSTILISLHYKFALDYLFVQQNHSHVIILEDDMQVSKDFIKYFESLVPLFGDSSVFCISAWNDNGFTHLVNDSRGLFRTDFFPGNGWMINKEIWLELRKEWPTDKWDEWMRRSSTHKGRDCICPEIPRIYNIGEEGVNVKPKMYSKYLENIRVNTESVDFGDISWLYKKNYDMYIQSIIKKATVTYTPTVPANQNRYYLLPYVREQYKYLATWYRMWEYPRATYNSLQILKFEGNTILLADRRTCIHLPPSHRIFPSNRLQLVAANQSESCTDTCNREGQKSPMVCRPNDFEFLNNCETVKKHFPCSACSREMVIDKQNIRGGDGPGYVTDNKSTFYGKCVLNLSHQPSFCAAANTHTTRLCPCMPSYHESGRFF